MSAVLIRSRFQLMLGHLQALGFPAPAGDSAGFSAALSDLQCFQLASYLELLQRWTVRVDLVSPAPDAVQIDRHIIDCAAALWVLRSQHPASGTAIDIGSGAGLPGLVWAILEHERRFILCEPREKRVLFLKEAVSQLKLDAVQVEHARSEDLERQLMGTAGLVVTRALAADETFLRSAQTLAAVNGIVVHLAGSKPKSADGNKSGRLKFMNEISYSALPGGPPRRLDVWKCFT